MAAEVIPCPSCRHDVRVPESLFGQPVRCPNCKAYFTAPTRDAAGILGQAEILADAPQLVSPEIDEPRPAVHRSVFLPAVLLLLVGICGLAMNGMIVAVFTFRMQEVVEAAKKAIADPTVKKPQVDGRDMTVDDVKEENFLQLRNVCLPFLGISLLSCGGAIAMLLGRWYGLALTGSVLSIVNLGGCCCVLGAPVGIYCLIKLFDPEIRASFGKR